MFKQSLGQLKKPITITTAAMYIAIYVVLYAAKIPIAPESRISVTFLPLAAAAYLTGPVTTMIVGGAADLLSCVFFPSGQYFPGFTISAIIKGMIFAMCLYRAKAHIVLRSVVAIILTTLLVNVVLNTLWLAIMYQKAFMYYFVSRFVKNIIAFPVEILGIILCIRLHDRTGITKYYI